MFGIGPATRVYLAAGATDLRKNFEGLYGLVRDQLACDPLSGQIFLFSNAQCNRLKLLFWGRQWIVQSLDRKPTTLLLSHGYFVISGTLGMAVTS